MTGIRLRCSGESPRLSTGRSRFVLFLHGIAHNTSEIPSRCTTGPGGTGGDGRADDMSRETGPARAVNYGLDAPYVVRNLGLVGAVCVTMGLAFVLAGQPGVLGIPLRDMGLSAGLVCLLMAGWMYWGGTRGKLRY